MRYAAIALFLLLLIAVSCQSASKDEAVPEESSPETTTLTDASAGFEAIVIAEPQEPLDRDWSQLSLAEQKRVYLIEQHLQNATDLRDRLRLDEAEQEVLRALELDSDNLEAKRLLADIGTLLGKPASNLRTVSEDLGNQYALKIQQLRADAEDSLRKGELLLARGEYDAAVVEFSLARDHIRWAPYSIDWQGLDGRALELLERAQRERTDAAERERHESEAAAHEQLQAAERAQRGRQEAVLANLLEDAIWSFDAAEYDDAQELAEKALREDPRNERAREIRDAAFRSGRKKVRRDYIQDKREQFRRWSEEMEELRIPHTDVITLPDEDYWNNITELRSQRRGIDLTQTVSDSERELRQQLSAMKIAGLVISDEESLNGVIAALNTLTGLPLVVDPLAEEAALDAGVVFEFNLRNPLTVEKALNLITEQAGAEVTWTIRHDAILVTTVEKARGKLMIYNHDVQDLIFGLTDFLGPRLDRLRLLEEIEDDDGGGPFGGVGERPTIIEPDDLATLVQENVSVDTWDQEGVSINVEMGNMIVVHTPSTQAEIRQFLVDLRRFSSSLVTIESKFLTVADNWIQEIGVDFRGLDNPGIPFTDLDDVTNGLEDMSSLGIDNSGSGINNANAGGNPSAGFFYDDGQDGNFKGRTENFFLDTLGDVLSTVGGFTAQWTFLDDAQVSMILRAVEKSNKAQLVNDQVLSVHNTQRAYVSVVNQQAYIQDFDVEVAQFEAVADPQINVLTEGIVLDVRPTIHHDRKYLTLEIQPTVARVVALRDFSTSLGGSTSPVEFQLPELEVQSVFTTAVVPDGGSILLGGLSRVRNIERRAEVPWLANIPLVGFFFKEEGYSDEKQSLMIMIRAWITDVKQELARLERR